MNGDSWDALGIDLPVAASGEYRTTCPACSHERHKRWEKCLAVNTDKGTALCHHCGETFTVKQHADSYGTLPPPTFTRPVYRENGDVTADALAFFTGRGITRPVWERNHIGYHDGAIEYPYYRAGEVVNVKRRGRGKKFWMEQGAELILYGTDDIAPGQPLVWVEGEMDKLAVEVAGITACVSPPNGAPPPNAKNYAKHFAYLETQKAALDAVSRHIIAVDSDAPGRTLQDELVRRLGPERCWVATWPQGCKDANEVLEQHGADAVAACLANARAVPVEGVFEVNDLRAAVVDLYERGLPEGVNAGSDLLARHYRPTPGQWTIVTGIPSHGKSSFIDWLIHGIARKHGWQFAVCSPENQPLQLHISRLATLESGRPFGTGPHQRMSAAALGEALDALQEQFVFIMPADDFSIDNILAKARAYVYRRGIRGLVIDPWNEIEHTRPPGQREDEHISEVLTKVRRFARTYDVHVWLIAHPRTLQKVEKDGAYGYPVPTLYDISGGSQFRNKADMGLSIWRDTDEQGAPTQVHVQKVRFEHCGQIGMVELHFDPVTRRFNDYPVTHRYEPRDPWEGDDE